MNKLLTIAFISMLTFSVKGQDSLKTVDGVVAAFYTAFQQSEGEQRKAQLTNLLLPGAQMNSVTSGAKGETRFAQGKMDRFLYNSAAFYNKYSLFLDEYDRSVDFYADMASVNSIVYQTLVEKSSKQQFKNELWFAMDLVYQGNRWYIAQVTWTAGQSGGNLPQAVSTDTLWHRIEGR